MMRGERERQGVSKHFLLSNEKKRKAHISTFINEHSTLKHPFDELIYKNIDSSLTLLSCFQWFIE